MTDALKALQRFYAAEAAYLAAGGPGKGDFSVMAAHLTPDVVMYQAPCLPYGGTWRGHDGMERFMAVMSEMWSELTFREQHYAVDGAGLGHAVVAVRNDCVFRARATGREVDTSVLQWITVRDGLVSEFRPFYLDTSAVLAALRE
ncbi:nuclear transport factor 2 family protein [Spirillospora sp. CA-108201]